MERKYINHRRGHCVGVRHVHLSNSVPVRGHSESLLSELDPLELLLADSEELLLLSLDGPPEGAEPDFSARDTGVGPSVIKSVHAATLPQVMCLDNKYLKNAHKTASSGHTAALRHLTR